MNDSEGASARPLPAILSVLSCFYSGAIRIRNFLYSSGQKQVKTLPCRVISIGNLTVGGTGKTPMCMFVAEAVKSMGFKVAVITRGYGGAAEKSGGIVADGNRILMDSNQAGDEALMMAGRLEGIPVLVGKDRYASGMGAIDRFGSQVLVLDDGFQHRQLHRDIDLLLIDHKNPFGNMKLFPRGRLREPLSGIHRGDAVIFTRCLKSGSESESILNRLAPEMPLFYLYHKASIGAMIPAANNTLTHTNRNRIQTEAMQLKEKPVFSFSGIASNKDFQDSVSGMGANLVGAMTFKDHYRYQSNDFDSIFKKARVSGAEYLATTEKDYARIGDQHPPWPMDLVIISVDIGFEPNNALFFDFLKARLKDAMEGP